MTQPVWRDHCSWNVNSRSSTDVRIYELVHSLYQAIYKAHAAGKDDFVTLPLRHWSLDPGKPGAKKQRKVKLSARMFLDPESEEPWLLIFDSAQDTMKSVFGDDYDDPVTPTGGSEAESPAAGSD